MRRRELLTLVYLVALGACLNTTSAQEDDQAPVIQGLQAHVAESHITPAVVAPTETARTQPSIDEGYDPLANLRVVVAYSFLDETWCQMLDITAFVAEESKANCGDPTVAIVTVRLSSDQEREEFLHESRFGTDYDFMSDDGKLLMSFKNLHDQAQATLAKHWQKHILSA